MYGIGNGRVWSKMLSARREAERESAGGGTKFYEFS